MYIPKAKNDQHREGHIVHVSRTESPYCPVYWTEEYMSESNLVFEPSNFLICRLTKTKASHKAIGKLRLSDTTVRDQFNKFVLPLCQEVEPGSYCLHSLRSGGASTASNNGISERLISKHGRWKSDHSRNRYIKDSKAKRMSVSKSLGLWFLIIIITIICYHRTIHLFFLFYVHVMNHIYQFCTIWTPLFGLSCLSPFARDLSWEGIGKKRKLRRFRRKSRNLRFLPFPEKDTI